jgi:hypothetical protein
MSKLATWKPDPGAPAPPLEDSGRLGQEQHVVEEGLTVDAGNAEDHLRLEVDKDDGGVLRIEQFRVVHGETPLLEK